MERSRFLPVIIILVVLLALSAGLSAAWSPGSAHRVSGAQGPAPQGAGQTQAMLGSAPSAALGTGFTYQGQLLRDGNPITTTCTMTFTLYDDPAAGSPASMPINTSIAVNDGLFTVALDFGSNSFTGDARWLQIVVLCPGDAGANTLTPRQALTAAPYALSLRPGAEISGDLPGEDGLQVYNTATTGTSYGLHAYSYSPSGAGVVGWNTAETGTTYGVRGLAISTGGSGVYGLATATSGTTYGVSGRTDSPAGRGVRGYATATSGDARGVHGESNAPAGSGVFGLAAATGGSNYGVWGESASSAGIGVRGYASAASGTTYGMHGEVASPDGRGVVGYATAASGDARGVYGRSNSSDGVGVYGLAAATSGTTYGVYGRSYSTYGAGVYGYATSAATSTSSGVQGVSYADQGRGVYGAAYGTTALADGVRGDSYSEMATGVAGIAWTTTGTAIGVFGQVHSPLGYAGRFSGNVYVNGTFSADVKLFKIDHPLDPANRYLYHYSMESSEVLNQYSGNLVLGADGSAWVELPDWFSAINQDIRYQLTPVGAAAPGLYIAQEVGDQGVGDNRFQVAGGPPGLKVSWEITAVRSDPYIEHYGAPVEVEKPAAERGTYLHPELYGQPEELGLDYRLTPPQPDADLTPDTAP